MSISDSDPTPNASKHALSSRVYALCNDAHTDVCRWMRMTTHIIHMLSLHIIRSECLDSPVIIVTLR